MAQQIFPLEDADIDVENLGEFLNHQNLRDYTTRGMGVTANFASNEVTVAAGQAFDAHNDKLFKVEFDSDVTKALVEANGENFVYVTYDDSVQDSEDVEVSATEGAPSDPKLLVAVVNTNTNNVDPRNENPDGEFDSLTIAEASGLGLGDDGKLFFGANNEWSLRRDSTGTAFVIRDENQSADVTTWNENGNIVLNRTVDASSEQIQNAILASAQLSNALDADGNQIQNATIAAGALADALDADGNDIDNVSALNATTVNADTVDTESVENKDYSEATVVHIDAAGATELDVAASNMIDIEAIDDVTVSFANVTSDPPGNSLIAWFNVSDSGGVYNITWPASVQWSRNNTVSEIPDNGSIEATITSPDGGTTWRGRESGRNFE